MEVAALWEATTAWQPPAWLRPHQPAAVADVPSAAANVENGRCTVSRDGASVSTADAGDSCSTGNSSGSGNSDSDSEDVSGGGASTGRQAPASAAAAVQLQQPQQQREPALFDRLDALFAKGTQNAAGDLRNGAMRLLQCGHASPSGASAAPPAAAGPANRLLPPNSHQAAARLRSGIAQPVHSQQQGQHSSWPQQTSWQQGMRNGNSAHENPVSVRGRPCPGAEGNVCPISVKVKCIAEPAASLSGTRREAFVTCHRHCASKAGDSAGLPVPHQGWQQAGGHCDLHNLPAASPAAGAPGHGSLASAGAQVHTCQNVSKESIVKSSPKCSVQNQSLLPDASRPQL